MISSSPVRLRLLSVKFLKPDPRRKRPPRAREDVVGRTKVKVARMSEAQVAENENTARGRLGPGRNIVRLRPYSV